MLLLAFNRGEFAAVYRLSQAGSTKPVTQYETKRIKGVEAPSQKRKNTAPRKTIVMVGLMGAGKTCIGRRLAAHFDVPFMDADQEIEAAAGCSIADIFELYGEAEFREALARSGASELSLYVHIPFCERLCSFCACNRTITRDHAVAGPYLDGIEREADLLAAALPRGGAAVWFRFWEEGSIPRIQR